MLSYKFNAFDIVSQISGSQHSNGLLLDFDYSYANGLLLDIDYSYTSCKCILDNMMSIRS